jgi:hypothetical protein
VDDGRRASYGNKCASHLAVALALLDLPLIATTAGAATPTPTPTATSTPRPTATTFSCNVYEIGRDVSPALRTMHAASAPARRAVINQPSVTELEITGTAQTDPVLQTLAGPLVNANFGLHFDGLGVGPVGLPAGSAPPDSNGAVGAFQFIEIVNDSFAIFSKATGAVVYGPVPTNTLWAGFQDGGGYCANNNGGDPIVLYDHLANRWIMTQMSVTSGPYVECLAVSAGVDATGPWYRYAFQMPGLDYPKLGVWPDAYYMSDRIPGFGTAAIALDRNAMISGGPSSPQCFAVNRVYGLLPSDLDGSTLPPPGSPNYYLASIPYQYLFVYMFHVDFSVPANSTFTVAPAVWVAPYSSICGLGDCIQQAGVPQLIYGGGIGLNSSRVAYRNFPGDHESIMLVHGTGSVPTAHVGLRWYELRNLQGNPPPSIPTRHLLAGFHGSLEGQYSDGWTWQYRARLQRLGFDNPSGDSLHRSGAS